MKLFSPSRPKMLLFDKFLTKIAQKKKTKTKKTKKTKKTVSKAGP